MALTPNPKLVDLVNSLRDEFAPVYAAWRDGKESGLPASGADCLRTDLLALGKSISTMDARGHKVETRLTAEVLTLLAMDKNTSMPYEYLVAQTDMTLGTDAAIAAGYTAGATVPPLLMARVLNEWVSGRPERIAPARALMKKLEAVTGFLVAYDGNVSTHEIALFGDLEKQFEL